MRNEVGDTHALDTETIPLPIDACTTLCQEVNNECAPLYSSGLAEPTDWYVTYA